MIEAGVERWDVDFGPSRLIFGPDEIDRLGERAGDLGFRRVFLVSDQAVGIAGHVDRAIASLRSASIEVELFDDVDENPSSTTVENGASVARRFDPDGLVGLGGGSPMDCAKGINFVLTNGGSMEDYWGNGKADRPMLPSIGIPTTAGTGSEAQSYTLISHPVTGEKMACGDAKARFRTVILDPTLATTAPRNIVATSGVDAISHAVESFVSKSRNPVSIMYSRESWRLLAANFSRVLNAPDDPAAWGRMLVGAFLAGAAIEDSMLGAAHACANPLTSRFGVTHGHAVALMLPHVMRFNSTVVGDAYDELLEIDAGEPRAVDLVERIRAIRSDAGLPERLRDLNIPQSALPGLAADAAAQWTAGFNPIQVAAGELEGFYEAAW